MAALPFVDAARSPALTRALYLPGLSPTRNHYLDYVLLRRRRAGPQQAAPQAVALAEGEGQQTAAA